jgi:hypothetical protein
MALLGHVPGDGRRVASSLVGVGNERRWTRVRQQNLDLRVHDRVALDEIELYAEILTAVAAAERPLSTAEIDLALGIRQAGGREPHS